MRFLYPHCLTIISALAAATYLHATAIVDDTDRVFRCSFYNAGDSDFDATGTVDWTNEMRESAMRAINTVSSTLLNQPGRKINVTFAVVEGLSTTSVMDAMPFKSTVYGNGNKYTTKETWTTDDLGGKYAGQTAYVDNVEDVWRYGSTLINSGADLVVRVSKTFYDNNSFHYSDATGTLTDEKFDFETLLLHELGHPIGFYAMNSTSDGKTAFEQLTEEKFLSSRNKNVPFFCGENTMQYLSEQGNNVVTGTENKEFYDDQGLTTLGVYLDANTFSNELSSHISQYLGYEDLLMGPEANKGTKSRRFSELELYMLSDMGWTVNGIAIPEPSMFGLFAGLTALVLAGTRRRRK